MLGLLSTKVETIALVAEFTDSQIEEFQRTLLTQCSLRSQNEFFAKVFPMFLISSDLSLTKQDFDALHAKALQITSKSPLPAYKRCLVDLPSDIIKHLTKFFNTEEFIGFGCINRKFYVETHKKSVIVNRRCKTDKPMILNTNKMSQLIDYINQRQYTTIEYCFPINLVIDGITSNNDINNKISNFLSVAHNRQIFNSIFTHVNSISFDGNSVVIDPCHPHLIPIDVLFNGENNTDTLNVEINFIDDNPCDWPNCNFVNDYYSIDQNQSENNVKLTPIRQIEQISFDNRHGSEDENIIPFLTKLNMNYNKIVMNRCDLIFDTFDELQKIFHSKLQSCKICQLNNSNIDKFNSQTVDCSMTTLTVDWDSKDIIKPLFDCNAIANVQFLTINQIALTSCVTNPIFKKMSNDEIVNQYNIDMIDSWQDGLISNILNPHYYDIYLPNLQIINLSVLLGNSHNIIDFIEELKKITILNVISGIRIIFTLELVHGFIKLKNYGLSIPDYNHLMWCVLYFVFWFNYI